jgi:hypothetical protein
MQTGTVKHPLTGTNWHPVVNTDCLISLLCREFLWKESLDLEERMKNWFNQVDKTQVESWEDWQALTGDVIVRAAEKEFRRTLERSLCPYERYLLSVSVAEFVEIYDLVRLNVSNV